MSATMSSDWTLDLAHATATHVSGVTVVALRGGGRGRYRAVPLTDTLPAPGPGLSDDDCEFVARIVGERVREGARLLLERMRRRRVEGVTLH
ncbi:hypothetical protein [Lysobacter claricitrinus]|uniref:hypothetical protein n=1 Tax=Lysobacter claricitrinus TaxID=3367728 RepID=UPI0038B4016C